LTCGRSIPGRAVPFSDVKQIRTYVDDRLAAFCYACGGAPATRDHVPPKVFLDEPYPENLPVVGSCRTCNEGASLDEEYVACVLEVAARGTVDPSGLTRPKIVRKLTKNPSLAARLVNAVAEDGTAVAVEQRVSRVLEKVGRGLWTSRPAIPRAGCDRRWCSLLSRRWPRTSTAASFIYPRPISFQRSGAA